MKKIPAFLIFLFVVVSLEAYSQKVKWDWVKSAGGSGKDFGQAVAADTSGNVFLLGWFADSAQFEDNTLYSGGSSDIFLAKYNTEGNCEWIKQAGGSGEDYGQSVLVDKENNIYITGRFNGTAFFADQSVVAEGQSDIYLAKYNNLGDLLWLKQAGGSGADFGQSLSADNNGNIYMTGYFQDSSVFFSEQYLISKGASDIFIAKLNSAGDLTWIIQAGGSESDNSNSITTDINDNVLITGSFSDTAFFEDQFLVSRGFDDVYLASYDPEGKLKWLKQAGGSSGDFSHSVCCDISGDILITGYYFGTAFFENDSLYSSYYNNIFLAKYDNNGNYLWAKYAGDGSSASGFSVVTDKNKGIYLTGYFNGTAEFDQYSFDSDGNSDVFLARYDPDGKLTWILLGDDVGYSITLDKNDNIYLAGSFTWVSSFNNYLPGIEDIEPDYYGDNDAFIARIGFRYDELIYNNLACDEITDGSISFNLSGGVPPYSFSIDNGESYSSTGTFSNLNKGIYHFIIKDTQDSTFYDSLVISGPVYFGVDYFGCEGDTLVLDAGVGYTYNWNDGYSDDQTIIVNTSGEYYVQITDSNNCVSTDTINVDINPLPHVFLGEDTFIYRYSPYIGYGYIILDAGPGFMQYQWSTNDDTQVVIKYGWQLGYGTKFVHVVVTDVNGCINSDTIAIRVVNYYGIDDPEAPVKFTIYPVPAQDIITLEIKNEYNLLLEVKIINASGQRFYNNKFESSQVDITHDIDVSSLPKGIYFINIRGDNLSITKKILIF